jgi:hypothetical protein
MAVEKIPASQERYASVLSLLVVVALGALAVSFILYVSGLFPSAVGPEQVAANWHLKADEYAAALGQKNGWAWLTKLGDGEALSKAALALLGSCVLVCYAVSVYSFAKEKNRIFATLAALQIIVLIVAATGLGGGH